MIYAINATDLGVGVILIAYKCPETFGNKAFSGTLCKNAKINSCKRFSFQKNRTKLFAFSETYGKILT